MEKSPLSDSSIAKQKEKSFGGGIITKNVHLARTEEEFRQRMQTLTTVDKIIREKTP
jgi:hypothetical protein